MLAIFDGRVAKRPVCMKMPHKNAVSALEDGFLVNHFTSLYHDSVVISSEASFTFAYSFGTTSVSPFERYNYAHVDDVFCLYQGYIEHIDAVKRDFNLSENDDEGIVMIRFFQILRQLGQRISKRDIQNIFGNCISLFYEIPSKLVVLAGGSYHDLPIYWGIDARFNLIISSNETVVERACGFHQAFLSGQVYASCEGRTGQEALFLNKLLPYKVDLADKYFPISQPIETISKLILQADKDASKPYAGKWEPPLPDFVKINTDAVTFNDGMVGIGVVIRNSKGEIEYASTKKKKNSLPQLKLELQAFMEGLYMAAGFRLCRCILESVPLNLENSNMDKGCVSAIIERLVRGAGDFIKEDLCEFSVSFVSSSANKAARHLALLGKRKTEGKTFWEKETPECIAGIVESERPKVIKERRHQFLAMADSDITFNPLKGHTIAISTATESAI